MTILSVLGSLCFIVLGMMWITASHNAKHFPRLTLSDGLFQGLPPVTVMVPARNEADNIGHIVSDLLAQEYPAMQLLVLDDESDDGTASVAVAAARGDSRLRMIHGGPLPTGWVGKSWACHQLAHYASTDLLLFTDADVRWKPGSLAAVVAHHMSVEADLLTVWPTQKTETWAERLVVPLVAFVLLAYLPVRWAENPLMVDAAAANGQCLLFRRSAYDAIGGHRAVASALLDDVGLAIAIKRAGRRLRMVDGAGLLTCHMYHSWAGVQDGFGKSILAGHNQAPYRLALSTGLHLFLFVAPVMVFVLALLRSNWSVAVASACLIAMGVGVRAITAKIAGLRVRDSFWMPLSVLLMSAISIRAMVNYLRYGGPLWKGRRVIQPPVAD